MQMKVADYVAKFLLDLGIKHVFGITGGASLHLIHAVSHRREMQMVFPHHEQAAAMAADAYARITGRLGAAIATSGPGATNLLTGICCAYYDSIPVLYLTGQVATFRRKGETGVRQMGFQETDTVDICRPVTKLAISVTHPSQIRLALEQAAYTAQEGRPGPVLVDIPDDIQRADIDVDQLEHFGPPVSARRVAYQGSELEACIKLMRASQRPVCIVGWGVRLARAEREFLEAIRILGFPVLPTWGANDLLPADHPLLVGTFGTHGTRFGNFAVQNADLILAIGTRLDTHETGSPPASFGREAKKILVDIDPAELRKFEQNGMTVELPICADAGEFIRGLLSQIRNTKFPNIDDWKSRVKAWRLAYQALPEVQATTSVDPYRFVTTLANSLTDGDTIVSDTGCALAWLMQSFRFRPAQRFLHAFNNTPMGYALPAGIGAAFAQGGKRVICVCGDGSLQMNIQELATLAHHKLNIKIFVINNQGYSMIQQTQDQWLGSEYIGSSKQGGISMPDFGAVAVAYGIQSLRIEANKDLARLIQETLSKWGPVLCDVAIPSSCRVIPQVKFGRPIEDSEPLLPREEFASNMLVRPLAVSSESS